MLSERNHSSVAFVVRHDHVAASTCAVRIAGELDLTTAPELRRTLRALRERGFTDLILDLSEVTLIDSTALSVLLALHKLMSTSGTLRIAAASPQFARLLELTGVTDTFEPFTVVETDSRPSVTGLSENRDGTARSSRSRLTPGAAVIAAIAGTAIPFARTRAEQASRWLRILRSDSDTRIALASLVGSEHPQLASDRSSGPLLSPETIIEAAARLADARGGAGALDVLAAVLDAYRAELQPALEPDLAAYDAFIEQLAKRT